MSPFPALATASAPINYAARLGTVLGIWAHPDDEAFLSAGLMAAARDAGNRVVCVTATLGEHGTDNPARWPPHRLRALRRHELHASPPGGSRPGRSAPPEPSPTAIVFGTGECFCHPSR